MTASTSCGDEPAASLVPYLAMNVGDFAGSSVIDSPLSFEFPDYFRWTLNGTSLEVDWSDPTLLQISDGNFTFPTDYNVVELSVSTRVLCQVDHC